MSADMWCDFGKLILVDAIMFLYRVVEVLLSVQGNTRHLVFIKKQKTANTVNDRLTRRL